VLLGVFALVTILGRADRERTGRMEALEVGAPAAAVTQALQMEPVVCPVGSLEHLRDSFPADWSPAATDVALEQLAVDTRERWVYGLTGASTPGCTGDDARTEIGIGEGGVVLWSVAVVGRTTLELPEDFAPAGPIESDSI
jgi:hypothetical protein